LGVKCPLLPLKGYTFEIKAEPSVFKSKKILIFDEFKITASPSLTGNAWKITAFGDLAGSDKNTD
jgi:hypothetical protein